MSDYTGYFYIVDEPNRAKSLRSKISREGTFTDTLSVSDWRNGNVDVFLLSIDNDELNFVGLGYLGKRVATAKNLVRFSNLFEVAPPIPLQTIESRMKTRLRHQFVRSSSGAGGKIPEVTWDEMLDVIQAINVKTGLEIRRLIELLNTDLENFDLAGAAIVAQERDATNLVLRLADFDQKHIVDWTQQTQDQTETLPPFLVGLNENIDILEDSMISHDLQVFGEWEKIAQHQVGAVIFKKQHETLTIMNVNRHPVEKNLGVDLFYYHHDYHSYVMVQYKRMQQEKGGPVYRPLLDKSYQAEIARMQEFSRILAELEDKSFTLQGYRLRPQLFFFKLCPVKVFDPTSADMVKGMYMPLDYWEMLMQSPDVIGPKEGTQVSFYNAGRYFTNSQFINLVQEGWIGSRLVDKDIISDVIKESIEGKKSVILAAKQRVQKKKSQARTPRNG
ncbi:MAG: hypothetical protein IAE79_27910 [Anaerolinea sp.]|nr:hypothetical protein [Anaerolinea sp.]